MRGQVVDQIILHQTQLCQVAAQELKGDIQGDLSTSCLDESTQKGLGGGLSELKFQHPQDIPLHGQQGLPGVGVVCDVAHLFKLRSVDLFILGGYKHAGDTHKLQMAALDISQGQVPVNVGHRQEQGVAGQPILLAYFNQPVYQDTTHCRVDICLYCLHVGGGGAALGLGGPQVCEDVIDVFNAGHGVITVITVNVYKGGTGAWGDARRVVGESGKRGAFVCVLQCKEEGRNEGRWLVSSDHVLPTYAATKHGKIATHPCETMRLKYIGSRGEACSGLGRVNEQHLHAVDRREN